MNVPLSALLLAISSWIAAESDLPIPAEMPTVVQAAPGEITAMLYGGNPPAGIRDTVAVYHNRTRTIFLPSTWTGSDPAEVSVLVHEMVHHMEEAAGVWFPCRQAKEAMAYHLQERWLAQFGVSFLREFGVTREQLDAHTACGG